MEQLFLAIQNVFSKSVLKTLITCCFYALIISVITIAPADAHISKRKIRKILKKSKINHDHFTGFALYDQQKKKMIYSENADKYFTPARN